MRRVVITGMEVVTGFGVGIDKLYHSAVSGKSAIQPIEIFDVSTMDCKVAGYNRNFQAEQYLPIRLVKQTDPFQQMGLISAIRAVQNARIDFSALPEDRVGVIGGSSHGGIESAVEEIQRSLVKGMEWTSPFFAPKVTINHLVGQIAQHIRINGWNTGIANSCATGLTVIGLGFWLIRAGILDAVVVASSEKNVVPQVYSTFHRLRALAQTDPQKPEASLKSFHLQRSGTVLGDGAGAMVLEELNFATQRQGHINAEILGFGASNDAYHPVVPHPEGAGAALSMRSALKDAGFSPANVDVIHCHATATKLNDYTEYLALKKVFGSHLQNKPVTASKGIHGHLIGATGTVETALEIFALRNGLIPPIPFLDEPDPEIPLRFVREPMDASGVQTVLVNSFGFGGHNASLLIRKFPA